MKKSHILLIFILLFVISFFISLGNGAVKISPKKIISAIFFEDDTVNHQVIYNVRLPRTVLAGPNIIGVSAGGGLAALIILILFPELYYLVPGGAFVGSLLATLFIYALAWKDGALPTRLILAGAAVSAVGLLGFVGLMVPHIARLFIGSDYKYLFPASIFLGGVVVMLCDTLARVLFAPMEIPVGIIMSAFGAPFFLFLLRRKETVNGTKSTNITENSGRC